MNKLKIYIAGHRGMVGSAILRYLKKNKKIKLITKNRSDLDLTNQKTVQNFFKKEKIDQVYLAAAKVGGIYANNSYPAEFIYENIAIQTNVIQSAFENNVKKLLFLGSSCIYPKNTHQPMREEQLLSGQLEQTNEPYAIAKIVGIKLCESYNRQYGQSHGVDYRCVMPTNLYGPGDNYHAKNSHVIPGLIRRFHDAKKNNLRSVSVWGTGKPKREFLYVDDLARACVFIMNINKSSFYKKVKPRCSHINIGSGEEITIKKLSEKIKKITGYRGKVNFGVNKIDGVNRKLLDSSILKNLGWKQEINLNDGLVKTYKDFVKEC